MFLSLPTVSTNYAEPVAAGVSINTGVGPDVRFSTPPKLFAGLFCVP